MKKLLFIGIALLMAFPAAADFKGDMYRFFGTTQAVGETPMPDFKNGIMVSGVALNTSGLDSVLTGITAYATGGQTNATALTGTYNNVTTCTTAGDSVKLLTAATGLRQTVKNSGATTLAVFPSASDSINALAVNLSVDIAPGSEVTFRAISATVWETEEIITLPAPSTQKGSLVIQAADSAGNTNTTITNASQAAARTYTIPDAGANASFVMTAGAQTLAGIKTFSSAIETGTVGITGSALKLESLDPMLVYLNDVASLALDNVIGAPAAAANTAAQLVAIQAYTGGTATADTVGKAGGTLTFGAGSGSDGGAHTSNNPNGGAGGSVQLLPGSGGAAGSGGSGLQGNQGVIQMLGPVVIADRTTGGAEVIAMNDAALTLTVTTAQAGTFINSSVLDVDAESSGTETLTLPNKAGLVLYLYNSGGESITLAGSSSAVGDTTLATLKGAICFSPASGVWVCIGNN